MHDALKESDTQTLIPNLIYIYSDICQNQAFSTAKNSIKDLNNLIIKLIDNNYFNKSDNDRLRNALKCYLSKKKYYRFREYIVPDEISAKFTDELVASDVINDNQSPSLDPEINKRLYDIYFYINMDVRDIITFYVSKLSYPVQLNLTFKLIEYIKILHEPFNNYSADKLIQVVVYIRNDICQKQKFSSATSSFSNIQLLLRYMLKNNYFEGNSINELNQLLSNRINHEEYKNHKTENIPKEIIEQIKKNPTSDEILNETLDKTCTPEISIRLKEHINSYKNPKHKKAPIMSFLKKIYERDDKWYNKPTIIQSELLNYRANLLDNFQRNTAYNHFQNVKNSLSVLIKHGLLPEKIQLPDNLRRDTNTEKVRTDNPLICEIDMYDEKNQKSYINTPNFLESLKKDLHNNLSILVEEAQMQIYEGYHKFLKKEDIIAQSQFNEFINHPKLRVETTNVNESTKEINPFNYTHPLRHENLVAYYDHYFKALLINKLPHREVGLSINTSVLECLGLTPKLASAMQTIITEELGINPYSLYRVQVSSDGHGNQFILIDDEGSVRLRALKPRARHARTRNATGSLVPLCNIKPQDIDAATCLKMALEMTSRARKSLVPQHNENDRLNLLKFRELFCGN